MSDNDATLSTPGTQPPQGATSSTASMSTNANVPRSALLPFACPRRGLLLMYVGGATNDIFDTLSDTGTNYATASAHLTAHFDPVQNKDMDIYDFRQIKQEPGESLQNFHRDLKEKAILCEFPSQDVEIKTQIIHHTSNSRIRQKALRKSMDLDSERIKNSHQSETVNHTDCQQKGKPRRRTRQHQKPQCNPDQPQIKKENKQQAWKCMYCRGPFPQNGGRDSCPASRVKCSACSKTGHFAKCCLSKPKQPPRRQNVREISQADKPVYLTNTDEEFVYSINAPSKQLETIMRIANIPVKVILDTGSSVNLLNNSIFNKIHQENPDIKLETSPYCVFPYGADKPIELLGQFTTEIKSDPITKPDKFLVTKSNSKCLLSYKTCTALELLDVTINANTLRHANPEIRQILPKHKEMLEAMGNIKNIQVMLDIDPSIKPVAP